MFTFNYRNFEKKKKIAYTCVIFIKRERVCKDTLYSLKGINIRKCSKFPNIFTHIFMFQES